MTRLVCLWILGSVAIAAYGGTGCDRTEPGKSSAVASSLPNAPASASVTRAASTTANVPSGATPCGALGCLQFESPDDAFRYVLTKKPKILAVGEAHAQKGSEGVPSAAKRFTNTFLPFLKARASDLIVELMAPNPKCKKKTKAVAKKHEKVTQKHAPTNQNEYVQMGKRAKELGIVPDLLRPSCEDLAAINEAGDGAIAVTLETIARLTTNQVNKLLGPSGRKPGAQGKMIVTYGGVLHNDLKPTEVKAAWSYGPALAKAVDGSYIALDLFVPEHIESTRIWKDLPWFQHYDKSKHGEMTALFQLDNNSYVLIFPLQQ